MRRIIVTTEHRPPGADRAGDFSDLAWTETERIELPDSDLAETMADGLSRLEAIGSLVRDTIPGEVEPATWPCSDAEVCFSATCVEHDIDGTAVHVAYRLEGFAADELRAVNAALRPRVTQTANY